MRTLAIQTESLTRVYGRHKALSDVSLSVEGGSVYALVGPNGAGKTTLIQLLMNLQTPTSGTARILDLPSTKLVGTALNRIGYVSETQEMPDGMTVESFLDYLRPFYPTWDDSLESDLLEEFSLPMDRELQHLSRGMRMKVAFVSTLSYRPILLVLDEPFSGLDPLVRDELIQGLIGRIGESTIFLSSHDLSEIESFASHVGYLEQGSLLFSEEMNSLSGRYRRVFFRASFPNNGTRRMPDSWLEFESDGAHVNFKDSAFSTEEEADSKIPAHFPGATEISFASMSLRDIFLVNARSNRDRRAANSRGHRQ